MSRTVYPRISQAKDLLPRIRAQLVAAASRHSVPAGLSLDLLPLVEDGLIGYEFLPNRATSTYLTIGCDRCGAPVLRETSYCAGPPCVLRVATVNGRTPAHSEAAAPLRLRQRDSVLSNWSSAAEAAWTRLAALFPQQPRHCIEVRDARHACFDKALALACARLADCDPWIDFCGVPDEAQYGFALTHADGGNGRLMSRHPGKWALWFQSAAASLNEEWAMSLSSVDAAGAWVRASMTPRDAVHPAALAVSILPAAF